MTAETPLPTNRTDANSVADHVADHNTLHDRANSRIPAANPTGVSIQEVTPDPVSSSGKQRVVSFPADCSALAIKLDADNFPRWLICSDATDGIYLGDGTYDPYSDGANIYVDNGGLLRLNGADADETVRIVTADVSGQLRVRFANAASSLGSVVKKLELFDGDGNSIGFLPIYDAIT